MSALNARTEFVISGRPPAKPSDVPGAQHRWVSPGYFRAMRIPLRRGREFVEQDTEKGAGVLVIDQALAQRFFAGWDWQELSPLPEQSPPSFSAPAQRIR